jgi:hypothetical protein
MELLDMLTGPLFPALLVGFRRCSSAFLALFTFAGFCLSGCAGVNVVMLSTETFTPQTSQVEILEREPNRPYMQIAVLTVDSLWLGVDSKREKILEKARTLGADAVIFGDLHLQRRNGGKQTDAQNPSSPSLPPEEIKSPPCQLTICFLSIKTRSLLAKSVRYSYVVGAEAVGALEDWEAGEEGHEGLIIIGHGAAITDLIMALLSAVGERI